MAESIESGIQTQIDRLAAAKADIATAIAAKGVTVPDGTLLDGMAELISSISTGSSGNTAGTTAKVTVGNVNVAAGITVISRTGVVTLAASKGVTLTNSYGGMIVICGTNITIGNMVGLTLAGGTEYSDYDVIGFSITATSATLAVTAAS